MSIFGKEWGETQLLLRTPLIEIHRLEIKPYYRCSKHHHRTKGNWFYCESGELTIMARKSAYNLTDKTVLGPGQFTTVPPGEVHWFETGAQETAALEGYYLEPLSDDIVREDCGGPVAAGDVWKTIREAEAAQK